MSKARGRRNRRKMWLVGVLGVGLAATVLWLIGPQSGTGRTVDRFLHVHGLEITPWAPDDVYLATHEGLLKIDDSGEWRTVSAVPHDFMGFSANPDVEGMFYSSGHPAPGSGLQNPLGFMVSADGGAQWSQRSLEGETDFHAMAVSPDDGDVVYGWNGVGQPGLYASFDGGETWRRSSDTLLDQVGGALSLAVRPGSPQNVWAGTQGGLLTSIDGGETWDLAIPAVVSAVAFDPGDGSRLIIYAPDDGGLVESLNEGETWAGLGLVLDGDAVEHIAVHPEDPDSVIVGTFGMSLLLTRDRGSTWERLAEDGVPAS